ncbi:hypothetical protein LTR94_009186 [Friedmanniomyces endolithicus]|nr:hypothetical protein LTR94_009186 [Friedmanniomyces endolithicus]
MPTAQTTDVCKAGELQYLVGRPKTEIPVPVDVVNRRVTCTTCPVTHDFSAYRLNIFYDAQTGIIEQTTMKTAFILTTLMSAGLALSACAPTETPAAGAAPGGDTAFKACKVEDYQAYVGRNRSTVPSAPEGQTFRLLRPA